MFDYDDFHWPRDGNHPEKMNHAHWTVTFRTRCTRESGTVVPVPTSSSAAAAVAAAAADRAVKALRRGQVRDAEEEEQRQEEYTNSTSTYSGDYVATAPRKQICRLQSARHRCQH